MEIHVLIWKQMFLYHRSPLLYYDWHYTQAFYPVLVTSVITLRHFCQSISQQRHVPFFKQHKIILENKLTLIQFNKSIVINRQ